MQSSFGKIFKSFLRVLYTTVRHTLLNTTRKYIHLYVDHAMRWLYINCDCSSWWLMALFFRCLMAESLHLLPSFLLSGRWLTQPTTTMWWFRMITTTTHIEERPHPPQWVRRPIVATPYRNSLITELRWVYVCICWTMRRDCVFRCKINSVNARQKGNWERMFEGILYTCRREGMNK